MNPENDFYKLLLTEILQNINNRYEDNYDEIRFGKTCFSLRNLIKRLLGKMLQCRGISLVKPELPRAFAQLSPYLDGISFLYGLLNDAGSKRLLIQVVTYKILGNEKYKLPMSTPRYWERMEEISAWKDPKDFKLVKYRYTLMPIHLLRLKGAGLPFEVYSTPKALYSIMEAKQYEYVTDNVSIKAEPGDVVLDCGACWGDSSLFFAHDVKESGHVYSFEFIPGNISVFNANINLKPNACLKDRITLVPFALDEVSGREIIYEDNGPGSKVSTSAVANPSKATTICIDDFFRQYGLEKVDLIKMDIEGAELPSLKGANEVIRRFRPKLAISIYHSMRDFTEIAQYLDSLNLGYKFYLNHASIHQEETILMAIAPGKE